MPYKIEWVDRGVIIKKFGTYTPEENIQSNGELYGDPRFDEIEFQIGDFLEADISQFKAADSKVIGNLELKASTWNNNIKVAHLTKDEEFKKLIRIYEESLSESNWQFGIFDSYEKAYEWINESDK